MRMMCVLVGMLVAAGTGCAMKPVTREDRVAASVAASKMKPGSQLTSRQIAQLDKDQTYVCTEEQTTGSHIKKKTCRTLRRQGDEDAKAQEQIIQMGTAYRPGAVPAE